MIGLLSWIAIGALVGVAVRLLLPGPKSWPISLGTAIAGALTGGVLATLLGMGGLEELDPRALTLAFLMAVLDAVLVQLVRVMRGSGSDAE